MVGDGVGGRGAVPRVQCTFPNIERVAMLNEEIAVKQEKMRKKQGLVGDGVGGRGAVFRVQCAYPNMETFAILAGNS